MFDSNQMRDGAIDEQYVCFRCSERRYYVFRRVVWRMLANEKRGLKDLFCLLYVGRTSRQWSALAEGHQDLFDSDGIVLHRQSLLTGQQQILAWFMPFPPHIPSLLFGAATDFNCLRNWQSGSRRFQSPFTSAVYESFPPWTHMSVWTILTRNVSEFIHQTAASKYLLALVSIVRV